MKYKRIPLKLFTRKVKRYEGGIGMASFALVQCGYFYLLPTIRFQYSNHHGSFSIGFLFWELEYIDEATIFTIELGKNSYHAELHKIES